MSVENEIKGPADDEWADEARAERGAEIAEAPPVPGAQIVGGVGDDGEPVKGPGDAHWSDEARAERGAVGDGVPHEALGYEILPEPDQ